MVAAAEQCRFGIGLPNRDDLEGELGEDLRFVLRWTADNLDGGRVKKLPRGLDRSRLVDRMLHLLLETDRIQQKRYASALEENKLVLKQIRDDQK